MSDRPHAARDLKAKIALFSNVEEEAVITAKDVDPIYELPLILHQEGLDEIIVKYLHLSSRQAARAQRVAAYRRQNQKSQHGGDHRNRRQIRPAQGLVQES